jgi:hypothetical protein
MLQYYPKTEGSTWMGKLVLNIYIFAGGTPTVPKGYSSNGSRTNKLLRQDGEKSILKIVKIEQ